MVLSPALAPAPAACPLPVEVLAAARPLGACAVRVRRSSRSRSGWVAVPAVPVGVGAALLTGFPLPVALGWLLPGAALCALVLLAGTTRFDPATVAASLGALWAVGVCLPAAARRVPADVVAEVVASPTVQLIALAVALAAAVATVARRDAVSYRRTA